MKREYFNPKTVMVDIAGCDMLVASTEPTSMKPRTNGSAGQDIDRSGWGNLWDKN